MAQRIPVESIVVRRDGRRQIPTIGKKFDFTADEIAEINRIRPQAFRKVSADDDDTDESVAALPAGPKAAGDDADVAPKSRAADTLADVADANAADADDEPEETERDPLDHDGDGKKGGSVAKDEDDDPKPAPPRKGRGKATPAADDDL